VSGAELRAYLTSPGVLFNRAVEDDVEERAKMLVTVARDEHLRTFGHPMGAAGCTLPGKADAVASALVSLRAAAQRPVFPWGAPTSEIQAQIRRLAPWAHIPDPGGDPVTEAARRDLAVKLAGGMA
jgi:hypothetical protein